jgi:hypothetical protein
MAVSAEAAGMPCRKRSLPVGEPGGLVRSAFRHSISGLFDQRATLTVRFMSMGMGWLSTVPGL